MLVDGVIVVVVAASLLAALLVRRRSHDDVHSVEGYHRQIHTLEAINEHPAGSEGVVHSDDAPRHAYPESAVRLTDSTTVRLIGSPQPPVPPVAPPPVAEPVGELASDDALISIPAAGPANPAGPADPADHAPVQVPGQPDDPAVNSMNRRPRRLLAPGLAIAAVTILIVVLLIVGSHSTTPPHHTATPATHHRQTTGGSSHSHATTTTAAPAPVVSAPQSSTANAATYQVGVSTFTLVVASTSSSCWINVSSTSGATVFSGTLTAGQQHSVAVTGPVSVVIGAPSSFAATVNGAPVSLPTGFQTPLTLNFATAPPST